jgi:hypothetical protein
MQNINTSNPPMHEAINSANAAASTLFLGHNGEWWDFWLIARTLRPKFASRLTIKFRQSLFGAGVVLSKPDADTEEAKRARRESLASKNRTACLIACHVNGRESQRASRDPFKDALIRRSDGAYTADGATT